jgi:hypothetical protein
MMNLTRKSLCRPVLLGLALSAATAGAQAATVGTPITIKYLFNSAATPGTFLNPGLDPGLTLPATLTGFTAWSDSETVSTLTNLNGQSGSDKAIAARSWHDGNAFNFSFDVAAGSRLSITQIDFWQQGSSGGQGNGPTNWTMSINGQQIGSGTTTLGNQAQQVGSRSLSFAATPIELGGAVAFRIFATGATDGAGTASNATWRVDNFTITGDVAPVPVPAAVWLMGSALAALAARRRRLG